MAKLNKNSAKEVESAASGFDPLPDGAYHFILKDVDPSREGKAGPYWSWEFECVETGVVEVAVRDANGQETGKTKEMALKGRRQWNNTSLSQAWSLKQTFDAFGVPADTDTDELLGTKPVKLVISQRVIQEGNRKGELTNNVDRVMPPDEDFLAGFQKRIQDEKEMAEIF
jgi:hypothetical protein